MCISYFSKRVTVHRNLGYTVYSMYVCMHACMYVCYESQPKAWAEYRYKRSEAKLVWGVWGEALIWLRFGKVRPEPAWGELKKRGPTSLVFEVEREAPFWTLLVVF